MRCFRHAIAPVVCLLTAIVVCPAADDTFAPYRQFKLADSGRAVTPGKVRFSHLELEVADGQVFPITNGAGEILGFQFEGHGTWRYAVKGREALMTYRENADRVSRAYDVAAGQVRDKFTRATVLFARPAFEGLAGPGNASVPTPQVARDDLRKSIDLMALGWAGFDHFAAEARLGNVAGQQYVYAEFEGGEAARTGYVYDAVRSGREILRGFIRNDYGRFPKEIATEVIDGVAERTPWQIEHVDLDVNTRDNRSGTIRSSVRVKTVVPGVRVLAFGLMNHRNRREYGWQSRENVLEVQRVRDDAGRELSFSHRYFEIVVDLGEQLPAGRVRTLTFETGGDVFTAAGGFRGDQYIDLYTGNWFRSGELIDRQQGYWFPRPIGVRPSGYTLTASMRSKKPFLPVLSGDAESLVEDGDGWVLKSKSETPIRNFAALAGQYSVSEIRNERWTVKAYSYGAATKDDRERVAHVAAQFIEIYEKMLGPFPHRELNIVEMPSVAPFSASPAGILVLSSRWFSPREWAMNRELAAAITERDSFYEQFFSNRGLNATLAHEIAHQWFDNWAWPLRDEDAWLSESCAEYMAGLAIGVATQGQNLNAARVQDFKGKLDEWRSWNAQVKPEYGISAASFTNDEKAFAYRIFLLSNRGPLVLHMLRTLVGDARFNAVMRQYLEDAARSARTTDDFAASASRVLGQDMRWFFDQWFRGTGNTAVKVEQSVDSSAGAPVLKARLRQATGATFRKLHVPFILTFPDGHREVRLAFQEQPAQEFSFPLPAAPTKVEVDPSHNNLVKYE